MYWAAVQAEAVLPPTGAFGGAMISELDIFMGNMTLINEDVYHRWLDGDLVSAQCP